jgi:hypothetical protein
MKNLTLIIFTLFLAYGIKAETLNEGDALIMDSYEVVKNSKDLRNEVSGKLPARSVASLSEEDAKWLEYWQDLEKEPTEDPTYWVNKAE